MQGLLNQGVTESDFNCSASGVDEGLKSKPSGPRGGGPDFGQGRVTLSRWF